jgi:hypothetical protein
MIFGRLDERHDSGSVRAAAATASAGAGTRAESAIGGNGHTLRSPRPDSSATADLPAADPYHDSGNV